MLRNRICVFCAASDKCSYIYLDEAEELGRLLVLSGRDIIYGGGKVGLMGRLADGALSEGGKVIGIIPRMLKELELGHDKIEELREVEDLHHRQSIMMYESDAIIALPGGTGTFEELLQAITWKRLGLIESPILIVNFNSYYAPLIEMLDRAIREKFMSKEEHKHWEIVDTGAEAIRWLDVNLPVVPDSDSLLDRGGFA